MDKKPSDKDTPPMSMMPQPGAPAMPPADFSYPFYNFVSPDMAGASAQAFAAAQQAQALAAANYYARLQQPQLQAMPFMHNPAAAAQMGVLPQQQQQQQQWMWMAQAGMQPPASVAKMMPSLTPQFNPMTQMSMMPNPYAMPSFMTPSAAPPPPFNMSQAPTSMTPPAPSTSAAATASSAPHVRTAAANPDPSAAALTLPTPVALPPSAAALPAAAAVPAVPAMVSVECSMLSLTPNMQLPAGNPFCPPGVPPPVEYSTAGPLAKRQTKAQVTTDEVITPTAAASSQANMSSSVMDGMPAPVTAANPGSSSAAAAVPAGPETGLPASKNAMAFLQGPGQNSEVAAFSAFGVAQATAVNPAPLTGSPHAAAAELAVGATTPSPSA